MDDVYVIHATSSEDEEGTVDVVDHHDGETVILLDNSDSDSDSSHSPFHGHTGKRSSTTEQNQKAKQQVKEHDTDASGDGSSADDDEDDVEEVLPLTKEEEEEEEEFISLAEPGARDGDGRPLKHAKVKVDSLEQHRTAQDFFLAPWLRDQYSEQPIIALHQEIEDFYQWVQPREYEAEIRKAIILQVEQVVLSLWPHAQVDVFGSFRTGLYLPTRYDCTCLLRVSIACVERVCCMLDACVCLCQGPPPPPSFIILLWITVISIWLCLENGLCPLCEHLHEP
eukprot:m.108998 g.108998  ORF g.108998 m.108998 type:complete len:282 (+) comp13360_c1_seq2:375-1220(+)